jgi:hypothetical protein
MFDHGCHQLAKKVGDGWKCGFSSVVALKVLFNRYNPALALAMNRAVSTSLTIYLVILHVVIFLLPRS